MSRRQLTLWCASMAVLGVLMTPELRAQYAQPPDAYSATEVNSMFGAAANMQIFRDGSKAMIDLNHAGKTSHTRTLYDLQSHQSYSWDTADASSCSNSTFSGDWGDPFAMSAEFSGDLAKQHATETGSTTLNGMAVKIFEADIPQGKAKVWVEQKYGLVVQMTMTPKGGQPQTMLEVKQLSVSKPAASTFAVPPGCAKAAAGPRVPTESERIASETGGNAQDFANAIMPPPSKNSCTVLLKVVRAGTLAPVTSGFQVAVDTAVDVDHPAHYTIGGGGAGRWSFSGGALHEVTGQLRNGVVRIENAPAQFEAWFAFGTGGDSSALIYRQCFAPQTVLLLVVKNPDKLSEGADWLWVKSGKLAADASVR